MRKSSVREKGSLAPATTITAQSSGIFGDCGRSISFILYPSCLSSRAMSLMPYCTSYELADHSPCPVVKYTVPRLPPETDNFCTAEAQMLSPSKSLSAETSTTLLVVTPKMSATGTLTWRRPRLNTSVPSATPSFTRRSASPRSQRGSTVLTSS